MGIIIDFEEAKKKLYSPVEQQSSSEKMAAVRNATDTFLFSRQSLRNRVFLTVKGVAASELTVNDEVLLVLVDKLLPYIEAKFLKLPPKIEVADGQNQASQE